MQTSDLLILDGENRTTLGIVRNLSRKGISIIVGSSSSLGRSNFSRAVKQSFSYSADPESLDKAHASILRHVTSLRPKVLMPIMDPGWLIVHKFFDEYQKLTNVVPNPGKDLFEKLTDKSGQAELAEQNGIPIPTTLRPATMEDALAKRDELPYPVLLKPQSDHSGKGIRRVDQKQELEDSLKKYRRVPIIQELIEGEDLELTILCIHGQPIAGSVYLSLRNAPLPYGPPVACRSIKDESLMTLGMTFLKKLRYHGVAHLDFRKDMRDGQPKLLDFNTRLAGTNDVSLISGVDFAYLLYKMALGESVDPVFDYELDKEFRWLLPGELRHLFQTSEKLKTLGELMRWRNVSTEISITDPLPQLAIMVEACKRLLEKHKFSRNQ